MLHCAGPFRLTHAAMLAACLARGVHYLDITGEIPVFESIASRDAAARRAGITLLPGAGFDVVPSDCLAAHLKRRLPSASRLALGFTGTGGVSRGTLRTALDQAGSSGAVRRDGLLVPIPLGSLRRSIDFGSGPREAVAIPWGDLATAWRSTSIPNLETYMAVPAAALRALALLRLCGPLLRTRPLRHVLSSWAANRAPGPDAAARFQGRSRVWGEATDDQGRQAVARILGPEGYALTVETALLLLQKVLRDEAPVGYQTPATAFGPDLVLEVAGVSRVDVR